MSTPLTTDLSPIRRLDSELLFKTVQHLLPADDACRPLLRVCVPDASLGAWFHTIVKYVDRVNMGWAATALPRYTTIVDACNQQYKRDMERRYREAWGGLVLVNRGFYDAIHCAIEDDVAAEKLRVSDRLQALNAAWHASWDLTHFPELQTMWGGNMPPLEFKVLMAVDRWGERQKLAMLDSLKLSEDLLVSL